MLTRSPLVKVIMLIILCLLMAFRMFGQNVSERKINFPSKDLTIGMILEQLTNEAGITFSYSNNFPLHHKVKLDVSDLTVFEILNKIKKETDYAYKLIEGKVIFLPEKKYTVSGYIRDESSGENLIGANIYSLPRLRGVTTNNYGHFSLTLPADSVNILSSYVGYETKQIVFFLGSDTTIIIGLKSKMLQEVVISGTESIQDMTRMSSIEMPVQQIKALPALAGEIDVIKSLQLMPGVQAGAEGSSSLYVRGGSPDQNLILLDGVPVYNASHLFGFFSVFNSDAINHVELIKGGFPARYGGRLSSVIDISLKEGNQQKLQGEGSVGLISSKLTLEGPIKKNRSSFIISARRSFADIFYSPLIRITSDGAHEQGYYFYDVSAKVNQQLNKRNRLFISIYSGNDKVTSFNRTESKEDTLEFRRTENYSLRWGNLTTAMRLNTVVNPKLFSNLTVTYSQYKFDTRNEVKEETKTPDKNTTNHFRSHYASGIRDLAVKQDIDFVPGVNNVIKTGVYGIYHYFSPGALSYRVGEGDTTLGSYNINTLEYGAYLEDDISLSRRVKINLGVHYSAFAVEKKTYTSVQPRIALRYLLSDKIAVKASYVQMQQYIHLLTNAGIGLPTDLWVPATPIAEPEQSWQTALGLIYNRNATYEFSIESYYKHMTGLVEYKNGASFMNLDKDWQTKIETGMGQGYGGEFLLRKKEGAWTGWLGYTLAWANRKFENIDEGKRFPFKYDRRHDLETAVIYMWNKRMDFAFTWMYGSGYPTTLPTAAYRENYGVSSVDDWHGDRDVQHYPSRNNFRMRAYHRLDFTISFFKQKKWGERKWIFGLYNAYSRKNPFYLGIQYDSSGTKGAKIIQYSLFPMIPAVSYSFKF
jgi:hypothetical protein